MNEELPVLVKKRYTYKLNVFDNADRENGLRLVITIKPKELLLDGEIIVGAFVTGTNVEFQKLPTAVIKDGGKLEYYFIREYIR